MHWSCPPKHPLPINDIMSCSESANYSFLAGIQLCIGIVHICWVHSLTSWLIALSWINPCTQSDPLSIKSHLVMSHCSKYCRGTQLYPVAYETIWCFGFIKLHFLFWNLLPVFSLLWNHSEALLCLKLKSMYCSRFDQLGHTSVKPGQKVWVKNFRSETWIKLFKYTQHISSKLQHFVKLNEFINLSWIP